MSNKSKKLLDLVHETARRRHLSVRTEQAYTSWIRRFILYHNKRHPKEMNTPEIEAYLTHLAIERKVSAGTQNQAMHALIFLYEQVLKRELKGKIRPTRARQKKSKPQVPTEQEVERILDAMTGPCRLIIALLYGSGLRISECLRLRVKDLIFDVLQIQIMDGKGGKDRLTMLPKTLVEALQTHLKYVRCIFERDKELGFGATPLPYALDRKFPTAHKEWSWQYVFPAKWRSMDKESGRIVRRHLHAGAVRMALKQALKRAGIHRPFSCHSFRHGFTSQSVRNGNDMRKVQVVLGHESITTTDHYTHNIPDDMRSPLDEWWEKSRGNKPDDAHEKD